MSEAPFPAENNPSEQPGQPQQESREEKLSLAQRMLRTQQDLAFAAGKLRTARPAGSGLGRKQDETGESVRDESVPATPSGWRPAPGMARSKTGPGPSRYDPQRASSVLGRFLTAHQQELQQALIYTRWAEAVGPQIAQHTKITAIEGDRLIVAASSTNWANVLQMNLGIVLRRLAEECGEGVVNTVIVRGPSAQHSWKHGPRSVPGRGVRDTYG